MRFFLAAFGMPDHGVGWGASAAQIRFVHTSASSPALDFQLNGTAVAYGVSFSSYTSYLAVSPGTYSVAAERASSGQRFTTVRATLSPAHQYTAIVGHPAVSVQERIYEDQGTAAPAGEVAVRVINEADSAGPLDVYLIPGSGGGMSLSPLVTGLSTGAASAYLDVPASATYAVGVLHSGGLPVSSFRTVLTGVTVRGGTGAVRTVVITDNGLAGGNGLYGFVLDDLDPI